MKNRKRMTAVILAAITAVSLTACSGSAGQSAASSSDGGASVGEESYKIGVLQYATHGSLDNCYEGLLLGLEEEGLIEGQNLEVEFQNAQNDTGNSDMIAKNMVAEQVDLFVGIATPAAMSG